MIWVALLIAVVLVGLTVAGILGRIDGSLAEPTSTISYLPLPQDRLTPEDVDALRFDTAFRGYRMDQVDDVLTRLTAEITQLRAALPAEGALVPAETGSEPPAETGSKTPAEIDSETLAVPTVRPVPGLAPAAVAVDPAVDPHVDPAVELTPTPEPVDSA